MLGSPHDSHVSMYVLVCLRFFVLVYLSVSLCVCFFVHAMNIN